MRRTDRRPRATAERERSTWTARREALALGLTRKDGAGRAAGRRPATARAAGLGGSAAQRRTRVRGGGRRRARCRGRRGRGRLRRRRRRPRWNCSRADDAGRAGLLVGGERRRAVPDRDRSWPAACPTVRAGRSTWSARRTRCGRRCAGRWTGWPSSPIWPRARPGAGAPDVRAVTPDGDLVGPRLGRRRAASAPSALEIQAAVDEADAKAAEADRPDRRRRSRTGSSARRRGRSPPRRGRADARAPCTSRTPGWPR